MAHFNRMMSHRRWRAWGTQSKNWKSISIIFVYFLEKCQEWLSHEVLQNILKICHIQISPEVNHHSKVAALNLHFTSHPALGLFASPPTFLFHCLSLSKNCLWIFKLLLVFSISFSFSSFFSKFIIFSQEWILTVIM